MKKWILILTLLLTLGAAAGCGNTKKTDNAADNQQNTAQTTGRQFMQGPEGELARSVMSITRIQRSEAQFTKEQKDKLLPLLQDIKAKETVDEAYANKKIEEINLVLTEQQKQLMSQGPGGMGRNRGDGNANNGGQPQGSRPGNGANPNNPANGVNPNSPGSDGAGFDLKSVCDRAIEALK